MPQSKRKRVELVSPAGTLEKLRIALRYGADAVYLSGKQFGLRRRAGNLSVDEIALATAEAHGLGRRVYLTLNIFAHGRHIDGIREYCEEIKGIGVDAVIISDPGVFSLVHEAMPEMRIHISTQANTTNALGVRFWQKMGAVRVILSRELSLNEISEMAKGTSIDIEAFVHGAMCISYSGRCLLSSYLARRSANLGDCAHSCRWEYKLLEMERPDEPLGIEEDGDYTYIMSSRDLCMIEHVPELIRSGVSALKIEGRMKSAYYTASATRIYREAVDRYYDDPKGYRVDPAWTEELARTTTKGYTTGFYFGSPLGDGQKYDSQESPVDQSFLGIVTRTTRSDGLTEIKAKNKITPGIEAAFVSPDRSNDRVVTIYELFDKDMDPIDKTQPNQIVLARVSERMEELDILCRRQNGEVLRGNTA
jgi:putative protease